MPIRRGRGFAPQNTFLETIFQKFDRESKCVIVLTFLITILFSSSAFLFYSTNERF